MKVSVIGGGSTYTPELIHGFINRFDVFPLSEICLMDIDERRLEIVGGFAQRMTESHGSPFDVNLCDNRESALTDASYVITQLRVGMMPARLEDEYLGKRHDVIGQETTGIGGMANAFRTIPVMLDIASDLQKYSSNALLINFTNPAGLITEALYRYAPGIDAAGLCNVPITTKMEMKKVVEDLKNEKIADNRVKLKTLGLNHLSWHYGLTLDGENVWSLMIDDYLKELYSSEDEEWDIDTIKMLGMIPNYYLQYFYYSDRKLAEQENWPPSRAEQVMKIEEELLQIYAAPNSCELPDQLMERGGAYYSTLATQLISSHFNDLNEVHVVNVRNNGAVEGWPVDWVLELPCQVNRSGIHPLPADPLPEVCYGLLAQVKSYELLTVEAAVHGDQQSAYLALLAHPLSPTADKISVLLDDLINTNRGFLPQFEL